MPCAKIEVVAIKRKATNMVNFDFMIVCFLNLNVAKIRKNIS
jgi:hypothetical protein